MSRTINKVELLGRVGTDPEMQYTPGGTAVTKLRLATDRYRKEGEDATDWHNIVCWSNTAEAVNQYVAKGRPHLRRRAPGPEQLGGRRRPAPPPHRGPRLRGRVPRLPQRERQRRRLGHRAAGRRLSLLVSQPQSDAFPKAQPRGRSHLQGGGPALCSNR